MSEASGEPGWLWALGRRLARTSDLRAANRFIQPRIFRRADPRARHRLIPAAVITFDGS